MGRGPRPGGIGGPDPGLAMRGAVDLGALAQAREAQAAAAERARARAADPEAGDAFSVIVDVDEATFQTAVIEQSYVVPVVIDFWADWCGPCKQLSPVLEKLATDDAGRWLLAKVDVDANQRLGQAFGVQSIPSLFAVVAGQPIPLFQGALPEPQVRQVLDELLKVAAENGVSGQLSADGAPSESVEMPELGDPDLDAAADAIGSGDLDGAEAAYRRLLARTPGDPDGTAGLALVGVMKRVQGIDPATALEAAQAAPDDVDALLTAADVLLLSGRSEAAFATLVAGVRSAEGSDRDQLRGRLLELFDVAGPDDPAVAPARLALANALF